MTPIEIIELGRRMRAAQRRYFKTKDKSDLFTAKALELEFDKMIERDRDPDRNR
jgi:hypothetical protein